VTSARPSDVNGASGGATPASPERSDRRRRDSAASAICCPGWRTSSPATALALGLQTNVTDHIHAIDTNPSACGNSENRPRYDAIGRMWTGCSRRCARPRERREGLLAFQRLNVPATLNTTFVSTNLIENVIRNWRAQSGNVKRWNEKEDMVSRWMASGLLWAEAGFRKVRHAGDLPQLAAALSPGAASSAAADAATSSSAPGDSAGQEKACQRPLKG
jgi:hypothetical protein